MEHKIQVTDFLTPSECNRACNTINELKHLWTQQHKTLPSYTLGASIGNTPVENTDQYLEDIKLTNKTLSSAFDWLYSRLTTHIEVQLGAAAKIDNIFGIPGFVIYSPDTAAPFTPPMQPKPHRDLQFKKLNWDNHYREVNYETATSMTAALCTPAKGGGMYWWQQNHDTSNESPQSTAQFHQYSQGELILVPNSVPHQAALPYEFAQGEQRITLQVHSLFCDGAWRLYF